MATMGGCDKSNSWLATGVFSVMHTIFYWLAMAFIVAAFG